MQALRYWKNTYKKQNKSVIAHEFIPSWQSRKDK